MIVPTDLVGSRRLRHEFLLTRIEVAMLGALPQDIAVPVLDRARAKAMPAPVGIPTGGRDTKGLGRAEIGAHSVALDARIGAEVALYAEGSRG
ncbi:hypothetical protein ACFC08_39935 [Streptomyces sp. NPDC056112]|uniref:hypothetical protein n=1 Tax=Streptomyces sp. NPDC056112 TaxID=3345715 RepID=UPI0035D66497